MKNLLKKIERKLMTDDLKIEYETMYIGSIKDRKQIILLIGVIDIGDRSY